LNLSKINLATIILIPKVSESSSIKQYRPINLINCNLKIISKLLAKRIAKVMDFIRERKRTTPRRLRKRERGFHKRIPEGSEKLAFNLGKL
jgi:hypothetical protein